MFNLNSALRCHRKKNDDDDDNNNNVNNYNNKVRLDVYLKSGCA